MEDRLRYARMDGGPPHGFLVRSTASALMDRPLDPPPYDGTVEGLQADFREAVAHGARRVVVFTHGYNNPVAQAEANARHLYEARFKGRADTVFVGFVWPSEGAFRGANLGFARRVPALGATFLSLGMLLWALGAFPPTAHWGAWALAALGAFLAGFVGYVVFLRFAVYYRDHYRASEYGAPDLADLVRQLDAAIPEPTERLDLSFIGHSMGAFVTTSAVRLLTDYFVAASPDEPLSHVGRLFRLENLVLVSPDIPVQAIISKRLNFLATSLRRFQGRFLFSNGADVVLDPISTTVNSPVLPLVEDRWNVRLGNLTVDEGLPAGVTPVTDPDEYVMKLCTPHGGLREMLQTHRGKPQVPIAPDNAFTVVDCTGFRDAAGRHPLSRGHAAPRLLARARLFLLYVTGRIDTHSGYFAQGELRDAIARAAESGWAGVLRDDGGAWAAARGVKVLRLEGDTAPPPNMTAVEARKGDEG